MKNKYIKKTIYVMSIFILLFGFGLIPRIQLDPRYLPASFGRTHFIEGLSPEHREPDLSPRISRFPGRVEPTEQGRICQAFFSPHDDLQHILIDLINHEQNSIRIAIFMFTHPDIANALITAKRRGIAIEIITDNGNMHEKFSKIPLLKKEGISIFPYVSQKEMLITDIMHNKFVIFGKNIGDRSLVWTGSFNFTKSANDRNQENVVIFDELSVIDSYRNQFEKMKEDIIRLKKNRPYATQV